MYLLCGYKRAIVAVIATIMISGVANAAIEYRTGNIGLKLSGTGTGGLIEPEFKDPKWLSDWTVRAQADYYFSDNQTLGLVYRLDQSAVSDDKYAYEVFGLYENRDFGRIEIGMMHSVARKLSVGLPDVGGLRINDRPLFYKKITPDGAVIADTAIASGRDGILRVNLATIPIGMAQYGLSFAGATNEFDYSADFGLKIRRPNGKIKTAYSFGTSFMSRPDNYSPASYSPSVTADWRAQVSAGMNLQYNSWIWGLSGRAIYDENPIGDVSDGISVGTGVSYDLLRYSVSLTYILSDTGIWHSDAKNYADHTVVGSFRYKYSKNVDGWISLGATSETPFVSAGIRLSF